MRPFLLIAFAALFPFFQQHSARAADLPPVAFVNATVIDGVHDKPVKNMTVIVRNGRIEKIGSALDTPAPEDVLRIDAKGKYLLPGFVDSNVHATVYGKPERRDTVAKYAGRNEELALEFVQRELKYGVTTIRDSYGALPDLIAVRDRIDAGEAIGPRMLIAGNIVGWGGPFSLTFSLTQESELSLFQERWDDYIAQGAGEELMDMEPETLRIAINKYLDKGPDFIKYGGTSHFRFPSLIGFSPRAQKVIVEETHKRGLMVETHATSAEGLRLAIEAGVDLVQHPEILSVEYPNALIEMMVEKDVICAIRSNTLAGEPWKKHLADKKAAERELANAPSPATSAERRRRDSRIGRLYEIQRRNAERLIAAGCRVTIATDNYQGDAPEFRRTPKPKIQEAGIGSILAIEGLVELGMTEMEALMAATRNGAAAAGSLDDVGTVEPGKIADLILLDANPLRDISNIRRLRMVMARGRIIEIDHLPEQRIFSTD